MDAESYGYGRIRGGRLKVKRMQRAKAMVK